MSQKTLTLSASDLRDHPLLKHIPVLRRDEPAFTSLVESIRDHDLDYEVLIDSEQRVVDGRNRRNALAALKRPVPCREISDAAAASIIVASLVNRRHLTKGALAYLSAPLFTDVLAESKARQVANLRRGDSPETLLSKVSANAAPKTVEDVAVKVGVSLALMEQALKLRALMEKLSADDRAKYEPRILGEWLDEAGEWQDPVGLGYMINGLTSLTEEKGGKAKNLAKRKQHDRLFLGFLPKFKEHWRRANAEQKEAITENLKSEVAKWPEELRDTLAASLRAAARNDRT